MEASKEMIIMMNQKFILELIKVLENGKELIGFLERMNVKILYILSLKLIVLEFGISLLFEIKNLIILF